MRDLKFLRVMLLICSVFFIFSFSQSALAFEKVQSKSFLEKQLPNDVLLEKALSGELVKNEHTQVTVNENEQEGTVTVEIDKKINEEILPHGEVVSQHEKEVTLFALGVINDTYAPDSYAVSMSVMLEYDRRQLGGYETKKITRYDLTPRVSSSQFTFVDFSTRANSYGTGWMANGQMHVTPEDTGTKYVSPVYTNTVYKYTPNFVKYVPPAGSDVVADTAVRVELKYRRNLNGAMYSYDFTVRP